jgi:cytochrome c-type biogenesis protein CcmF
MCPGNPKCSPAEQADVDKRMIFADLEVKRDGEIVALLNPAKFIFKQSPQQPTTEVSLHRSWREDLYTVVGTVSPKTKRATFQFHINPLVGWIWMGVLVLVLGCSVSLWPEVRARELGVWSYVRAASATAATLSLSLWVAMSPGAAFAAERPSAPQTVESVSGGAVVGPSSPAVLVALGLGVTLALVTIGLSQRARRRPTRS